MPPRRSLTILSCALAATLLPQVPALARVIANAPGQPTGALTGRIVYMSAGHGWTYSNSSDKWYTQRGDSNEVVEDYGNLDQMNLLAAYCFNAGATVVAFRPMGYQTNEVVMDNTSPSVQFVGAWSSSSATTGYYGRSGEVGYRFATVASTETAVAIYTPNLSSAGFYPVYTWAGHGANRTRQLYRIQHSGGAAEVRVPHQMVGNGWVYLGTYFFERGSNAALGSVQISNLADADTPGSVVVADAIRFGNGMGDVIPVSTGGGTPRVSGYPREEECARYWIQRMAGVGAPASLYDVAGLDDASDNVGAPPRMAREMNREEAEPATKLVFVSFHSNASGVSPPPANARGCVGLYNSESLFPGTATPNQQRLAYLIASELNADMNAQTSPPLEVPWFNRPDSQLTFARSDFAFGEINNSAISKEFDATIIEVAFHDHPDDALLLRDPRVRNVMARAAYQGVVRYMNEFDGAPLALVPEPPGNVRAVANDQGVRVSWSLPSSGGGSATGYKVYVSTNGYGFGSPVMVPGGLMTSVVLTNLPLDQTRYFRVAALNSGGESMPSETVGCRASGAGLERVLIVNGFDRFERTLNVRQTAGPGLAGPNGGSGTFDRQLPRLMNSFDYVVQHGDAVSRSAVPFDSCQNEAVTAGLVALGDYAAVIWALGEESTTDETFSAAEQVRVTSYLNAGGRLMVSGSEIAWDLDRDPGPTAADRSFLRNQLHAALNGNANDDAGTSDVVPIANDLFAGDSPGRFDDGTSGIYAVRFPDVLTPVGSNAVAVLQYSGGVTGAAAIRNEDPITGSRVVYLGFPFETLTAPDIRDAYMFDVLAYFGVIPLPRIELAGATGDAPSAVLRWQAIRGRLYQVQFTDALGNEWSNLGGRIVAVDKIESAADLAPAPAQRFYRVLMVD